jgi:hypothetical protein
MPAIKFNFYYFFFIFFSRKVTCCVLIVWQAEYNTRLERGVGFTNSDVPKQLGHTTASTTTHWPKWEGHPGR